VLKRYFIAGLLFWVPIGITLWVLHFLVSSMDGIVKLFPTALRPPALFGQEVYGFGVLVVVVLLFATGVLVTHLLGKRLLGWWSGLIQRVPVAGGIYKSVKQISDTVLSDSGNAFNKAVLVEFPHPGAWTIAFQTGNANGELSAKMGADFISVYVPTTPNPTSGYMIYVPKSKVKDLDMSVDQALKTVISMGVVGPENAPEGAFVPTPQISSNPNNRN
jgi:uncharacterized membrane protein